MRKFNGPELQIIKGSNGVEFTDEEIKDLAAGQASFRVERKAEQILDKHNSHMRAAVSRSEVLQFFMTRNEFNHFRGNEFLDTMVNVQALINLCQKNGLFTAEQVATEGEIIRAKNMPHGCLQCSLHQHGAECINFAEAKKTQDIFKRLPEDSEHRGKVIVCGKFEALMEKRA